MALLNMNIYCHLLLIWMIGGAVLFSVFNHFIIAIQNNYKLFLVIFLLGPFVWFVTIFSLIFIGCAEFIKWLHK